MPLPPRLRRGAKAVLLPVLRRLRPRLRRLAEPLPSELAALRADLEGLREFTYRVNHELVVATDQLDHVERQMPVLLNTISSQNARERMAVRESAALRSELSRVEQRLEFVRREVLFEMRFMAPAASGERPAVQTDPDALARIDRSVPIRLNLGAGHLPKPGFTNVDMRELDGIDLTADVRDLPFEPATVTEIHAAHLLEHFPEEELRRAVLPHWRSLLVEGGTLSVVVPDAESMLRAHASGDMSFDDLRLITFGEQEYEGDYHYTMFSIASLSSLLKEVGFAEVDVVECGRRNGLCLEMELHARTATGQAR